MLPPPLLLLFSSPFSETSLHSLVPCHQTSWCAVPIPPGILQTLSQEQIDRSTRTVYLEVPSLVEADCRRLSGGPSSFQAALVNSGWEADGRGDAATRVCGLGPPVRGLAAHA